MRQKKLDMEVNCLCLETWVFCQTQKPTSFQKWRNRKEKRSKIQQFVCCDELQKLVRIDFLIVINYFLPYQDPRFSLEIHMCFGLHSLRRALSETCSHFCTQVFDASLHRTNLQARHLFLGGYTAMWSSRIRGREYHSSCQINHLVQ